MTLKQTIRMIIMLGLYLLLKSILADPGFEIRGAGTVIIKPVLISIPLFILHNFNELKLVVVLFIYIINKIASIASEKHSKV